MKRHHDRLVIAHAPQNHLAFAVLGGFHRVGRKQLAGGLGNDSKVLRDPGQRFRGIEFPGHQQHGVIRLVVVSVEGLQLLDGNFFDVAERADGAASVGVPQIGGGEHALFEHLVGIILAPFEFVANHGHLGIQIALRDARIHHAVRLHFERPAQIGVAGGHGLEIVGAIPGRAPVEVVAMRAELAHDLLVLLGSLKQHVLEQMRHAGFPSAFVPRPDHIGHVDRDSWLGVIGEQEHLEAVVQAVFGDTLHRGDLAGFGRGAMGAKNRARIRARDARFLMVTRLSSW